MGEPRTPWFSTFEEFASARTGSLLRRARLILQDDHLAEDVVAEVLGRVWAQWNRVAGAAAPDAYVLRMLVNECHGQRRKPGFRRERPVQPSVLPDSVVVDTAAAQASRDEILRALARLSLRQRAVLVLRYYEDLDDATIGLALDINPGTVRYHASVALQRLRSLLAHRDPADPKGEQ